VTHHASKKRAFQDLELHTIELGKFEREMGEVRTTLERWAAFLTKAYTLKESQSFETTQNPEFQKAMHVLETLSLDDDERLVYDGQLRWLRDEEAGLEKSFYEGKLEGKLEGHLEGLLEGELKGKLEGKLEGLLEGKLEIAREMAAAGIDPEMIRRMTGLSDW
jgi:predicted transposase/invertase (TIGR01784 family)